MQREQQSNSPLSFTEDMKHENIKSLSLFLIQKYLEQGNSNPAKLQSTAPMFIGILQGNDSVMTAIEPLQQLGVT